MSEKDIENEATVIASINNQHANIVRVLNHGWLRGAFDVYYIDMELCQMTLADYMSYKRGETLLSQLEIIQAKDFVIVDRASTVPEIIRNIWTILSHISNGIEFLHAHGFVHRDCKPANSEVFMLRLTNASQYCILRETTPGSSPTLRW